MNSTVINLFSSTLSEAEEKLLSKGLNFCPTPTEVNQVEVSQNLTEYYRRLCLSELFLDLPRLTPSLFAARVLGYPNQIVSLLLKPTSRLLAPKLIHLITLSTGFTTTSPESNVRHSSLCVHVRTSSLNQRIRALGW